MIFGLGGGKNVICGTRWVKQSLSDSQNQEEESSSLLRDVFNRKKKGTGDEQINLALKHLFSAYRRKRRLKLQASVTLLFSFPLTLQNLHFLPLPHLLICPSLLRSMRNTSCSLDSLLPLDKVTLVGN